MTVEVNKIVCGSVIDTANTNEGFTGRVVSPKAFTTLTGTNSSITSVAGLHDPTSGNGEDGISLIYIGPRPVEIGTTSALNTGTLGGTLASGGTTTVSADGVVETGDFVTDGWTQTGSGSRLVTSPIGEVFEFWAKHTILTNTGGIHNIDLFELTSQAGSTQLSCSIGTDAFGFSEYLEMAIAGGTSYVGESPVTVANWNHYAFSRNSSNVWTYYVNGISRATTTVAFTHTGNRVTMEFFPSVDSELVVANIHYRTGFAYSGTFTPPPLVY